MTDDSEKPPAPDLPKYLREPLEKQSPERLETVASYATELAEWKRRQRQQELERRRAVDEVEDEELDELEDRGISTDPADYEDVPTSGAYITIKTTKQTGDKSYRYYYFQWREGDRWRNEYIAPVNPRE
jgi:Ni/Co efflux regulator RcnB